MLVLKIPVKLDFTIVFAHSGDPVADCEENRDFFIKISSKSVTLFVISFLIRYRKLIVSQSTVSSSSFHSFLYCFWSMGIFKSRDKLCLLFCCVFSAFR